MKLGRFLKCPWEKNLIWKNNMDVDGRCELKIELGGKVQSFMFYFCVNGFCKMRRINKFTRLYWACTLFRGLISIQIRQRSHRHMPSYWGAKTTLHKKAGNVKRTKRGGYDYWLNRGRAVLPTMVRISWEPWSGSVMAGPPVRAGADEGQRDGVEFGKLTRKRESSSDT